MLAIWCYAASPKPVRYHADVRGLEGERAEPDLKAGRRGNPPRHRTTVESDQRANRVTAMTQVRGQVDFQPRQPDRVRPRRTAAHLASVNIEDEARVCGNPGGHRVRDHAELNDPAQVAEAVPGVARGNRLADHL